jgi:hypothetical protein
MASSAKITQKRPKRRDRLLEGLEYHGLSGCSQECQDAVMRLLQYGPSIARARIISSGNTHCLLLTSAVGDLIAVKSGFSSGYSGKGPKCFSATLQLLDSHGAEIDECLVEESTIDRLDNSALTIADVENLTKANAVRPVRWFQYVSYQHEDQALNGTLWWEFRRSFRLPSSTAVSWI